MMLNVKQSDILRYNVMGIHMVTRSNTADIIDKEFDKIVQAYKHNLSRKKILQFYNLLDTSRSSNFILMNISTSPFKRLSHLFGDYYVVNAVVGLKSQGNQVDFTIKFNDFRFKDKNSYAHNAFSYHATYEEKEDTLDLVYVSSVVSK